MDSISITGLARAYPPHSLKQDEFENLVERLYPDRITESGLQKLIQFNRRTNIDSRPTVFDHSTWTKEDATPPTVNELSSIYQDVGVSLAAQACSDAMLEAKVSAADITHVVAVTCTDQSNPGYDLFVCQKLELSPGVNRVLLHGVGCAGGLSALRTAADIASAASSRKRPARILVVACELCSLFLRAELQACLADGDLHIAPALFSDAAAAVVLCNGYALAQEQKPVYQLQEWGSMLVPGTSGQMSYAIEPNGMIASITKAVPKTAVSAILPLFTALCAKTLSTAPPLNPQTIDWALHPGGAAILQGATQSLNLTNDHIRASNHIYKTWGNSSSPTVLIVLDQLRRMGPGRDDVVAASFGPGIAIEMFLMKRWRPSPPVLGAAGSEGVANKAPLRVARTASGAARKDRFWLGLQAWVTRVGKRSEVGEEVRRYGVVR